jgi:hypothetical protein
VCSEFEFHRGHDAKKTSGGEKAGMAEYRAYTVGVDGHFIGYQPLVCTDDAEAIIKAKGLVDGHDIELWSGPRLIIRLSKSVDGQKRTEDDRPEA